MRLGNAQTSLALHSTFTIFAPVDILDNDIKFVAGVGEARAKLLERELGIRTLGDMLSHYPFRYIDRTRVYRISEITDAAGLSYVQFRARVTGVAYAGTGRKRRFTAFVQDPTGSAELVWFQGVKWIEKRIEVGREYLVFGRPSFYRGELSMAHPELETMEQALSRKAESGMQGIYPSTEKLGNVLGAKGMYQIICNAWALAKDRIADPMPEAVRAKYGLIPLREAIYNVHFPQSQELLRQAQYRLKFDELLGVQLNIQQRRTERLAKSNGFLFPKVGGVFNTFYNEKLPFPLTGAQKRVIKEIRQDTVTGFQMNRLLQGDVGSGKTLVALMTMLLALCMTLLLAACGVLAVFVRDGELSYTGTGLLMLLFVLFILMSIVFQHKFTYGDTIKAVSTSEKHPSPQLAAQEYGYSAHTMAFPVMNVRNALTNLAGVVGGLALLAGGAQALLYSATTLANLTGTIQALWAATLISFGFCIPLLVEALNHPLGSVWKWFSVRCRYYPPDSLPIQLLNSAILNLTLALPVSGLMYRERLPIADQYRSYDIPLCAAMALVLLLPPLLRKRLYRWQGAVCLVLYGFYLAAVLLAPRAGA